jgi:hypothetical protein
MRVAILADIHEMLRQLSREISKCAAIIALLLHRTTPPVDLPCVRARTAD